MTTSYLNKGSSDPSLPMNRAIPRRSRLDQMVAAERHIQEAIWEIERLGASPRLTAAQNLLKRAQDIVSDQVDGRICKHCAVGTGLHEDMHGFYHVVDDEAVPCRPS